MKIGDYKMLLTKEKVNEIIGKKIRPDTYLFIQRMMGNKESYDKIYKDLDKNREKYNIKKDLLLTKEETVQKYIIKCQQYIDIEFCNQNEAGIYAIYINDNIVYIGETIRSFKERFKEHQNNMENRDNKERLYTYLRNAKINGDQITLKPLITLKELKNNAVSFTHRDLLAIEYGMIQYFKPILNIEGIFKKYSFNN